MSASIIKRLTGVVVLVAIMVVLLTLSRGTYARGDSASAEVGEFLESISPEDLKLSGG
jgi:hypothetical protein